MNLSKKKLILYFILLIFLIISLYFYLFLDPILIKTQVSLRDISVFKESMSAFENRKIEIKNIDINRALVQKTIVEKQSNLPTQLESHDLIHILSQANYNKLDRRSLIFLDTISYQNYSTIPVRFSFIADYNGLMDFLSNLGKLPQQPSISYMQISANKDEDYNQNNMEDNSEVRYNLEVEMTINFHVRGNRE